MKKEDLRVRRTRKLLLKAMFELMQTTPYDKISVSDVCEKAMVHRATFYNHFKDKDDLLNYGMDELQERMFESVTKDSKKEKRDLFTEMASNFIDFLTENRQQFSLILANGSEKLFSMIFQTSQNSIRYILSKNRGDREYVLPLEIITNFLAGGLCSVTMQQINAEKPYSKAELMSFFNKLFDVKCFVKGEK